VVTETFQTVSAFLDTYENYTADLYYVFRYDINRPDKDGCISVYIPHVFIRQYVYKPILCERYDQAAEGKRLEAYLLKHLSHIVEN